MVTMYLLIFVIGLVFGSFFNIISIRVLKENRIFCSSLNCKKCKNQLKLKDFIPIISWYSPKKGFIDCNEQSSAIYPIIEIFTGLTYVIMYYKYGLTIEMFLYSISMSFLIMASISDLQDMTVSNIFFILGSLIVLSLRIIFKLDFLTYLIGGVIMFSFWFLMMMLTSYKITDPEEIKEEIKEYEELNVERVKQGKKPYKYNPSNLRGYKLGGADVKIYLLVGLTIGLIPSFFSIIIAALTQLIVFIIVFFKIPSVEIMADGNTKKLSFSEKKEIVFKTRLPFIPFIAIGTLISLIVYL